MVFIVTSWTRQQDQRTNPKQKIQIRSRKKNQNLKSRLRKGEFDTSSVTVYGNCPHSLNSPNTCLKNYQAYCTLTVELSGNLIYQVQKLKNILLKQNVLILFKSSINIIALSPASCFIAHVKLIFCFIAPCLYTFLNYSFHHIILLVLECLLGFISAIFIVVRCLVLIDSFTFIYFCKFIYLLICLWSIGLGLT